MIPQILGRPAACILLTAGLASPLRSQEPVRVDTDTLSVRALVERFTTPGEARYGVSGELLAVMKSPDDPRGPEARSLLVDALSSTEDGLVFSGAFRMLVVFERVRPGWTSETVDVVRTWLTEPDLEKRLLAMHSVASASEDVKGAVAPILAKQLSESGEEPWRLQRAILGGLLQLGEVGDAEVDRLLEEGRLSPRMVNWIRFVRRGGDGGR